MADPVLDVATFRTLLPEFANTTTFPDAVIQFNITLAINSLNPRVWGDRLQAGVLYYAAHYVALAAARTAAAAGAAPGTIIGLVPGIMTSKSVGGVSASYDVSVGRTEGGGVFNLTTYGLEYLTLRDTVAVGVIQF